MNQILELVKQNAGEAIINNQAIAKVKNNEAINLAANSLFNNIKSHTADGNLNAVLEIFKGGGNLANNPI